LSEAIPSVNRNYHEIGFHGYTVKYRTWTYSFHVITLISNSEFSAGYLRNTYVLSFPWVCESAPTMKHPISPQANIEKGTLDA
jgi:hypothetical protein